MSYSRKFYDLPDGQMSAVHFGDSDAPPQMVFIHGTGFHGLAYRSLLEPLSVQDGLHIIALDLRGHGMTRMPADPEALPHWQPLRDDVLAFLDAYIDAPVVLAGHSLGAGVCIMAAAQAGDKVRGLAGLDPVTLPGLPRLALKTHAGRNFAKQRLSLARSAGKRRADFDSFEAVFDSYQGRGAFRDMPEAALRDYIEGAFVPRDGGGVTLTCPPLWEQATFVAQGQNQFAAAKAALENAGGNLHLVYAGKRSPTRGPQRAKMRKILGENRISFHAEKSHFFALEAPEFTREILRSVLRG